MHIYIYIFIYTHTHVYMTPFRPAPTPVPAPILGGPSLWFGVWLRQRSEARGEKRTERTGSHTYCIQRCLCIIMTITGQNAFAASHTPARRFGVQKLPLQTISVQSCMTNCQMQFLLGTQRPTMVKPSCVCVCMYIDIYIYIYIYVCTYVCTYACHCN